MTPDPCSLSWCWAGHPIDPITGTVGLYGGTIVLIGLVVLLIRLLTGGPR